MYRCRVNSLKIKAQGVRNGTKRSWIEVSSQPITSKSWWLRIYHSSFRQQVHSRMSKKPVSAIHSSIDDPEHLKLYEKEPLFVMPVSIEVGENKLSGYAYYDQKREQQERSTFYKRLYDLMEVLKSKNLKHWMNPGEVFRATAKGMPSTSGMESNRWQVSGRTRKNAVSQAINKMGKFVLLYRGEFSWIECLSLYRSKDVVEKGFDVLKNDIELMPANLRTNSSFRGATFIAFIALILRMKLTRLMIDAELNKRYPWKDC